MDKVLLIFKSLGLVHQEERLGGALGSPLVTISSENRSPSRRAILYIIGREDVQ
jgi:hypothetical protein